MYTPFFTYKDATVNNIIFICTVVYIKGERNKFSIILTNLLSIIRIHNLTITASNTFDFRSNWIIKFSFATSKTRPAELLIRTGF